MKTSSVLLLMLCLVGPACQRSAPPPAGDAISGQSAQSAAQSAAEAQLVGTTWTGYISHQNAEGASARFTWQFLAGGVLRHVRAWDDNRQTGTWRMEEGALVVEIGEYGQPGQYGTIDLERSGDTMKGETRWRSGYGFGWEFELERDK